MQIIEIKHQAKTVPIIIGTDLLTKNNLEEHLKGKSYCIITNETVNALLGARAVDALGKNCKGVVVLPDGEVHKNIGTFEQVISQLITSKMHRGDCIVALGGGVIGDIAGFVAATYMRGISYLQIPTTLLAQVDSSIGGKVAVNVERGKNLVGAFYPPEAIIIDVSTLQSLATPILVEGIAEVIKYGMVFDESILTFLYENYEAIISKQNNVMLEIVYRSAKIKADVVSQDEFENGNRKLLNFGHSFGHAIERIGNYTDYSHGQAVAIGMVMATTYSFYQLQSIPEEHFERLCDLLDVFNLPTTYSLADANIFLQCMLNDKKNQGAITLILLESIGKGLVANNVPEARLLSFLQRWDRI